MILKNKFNFTIMLPEEWIIRKRRKIREHFILIYIYAFTHVYAPTKTLSTYIIYLDAYEHVF